MNRISLQKEPVYLVINGLHRSGTTMLARLIDSQPGMMCIDGLFEMPQIIAEILGYGDRFMLIQRDFTSDDLHFTKEHRNQLKLKLMGHVCSLMTHFHSHDAYRYDSEKPVYVHGFSMDDYYRVLKAIITDDEPEITNPLTYFGQTFPDMKIAAMKWTGGHAYAPEFVKLENCYWLEIVRNPRDRFISSRLSHDEDLFRAVALSRSNLKLATSFKHPRYKVVLYENLCEDSEAQVAKIADWIGIKIENVQLKNLYGYPFKPNTSKNVTVNRDYTYQDEMSSSSISINDQDWKRNYISAVEEHIIAKGVGTNAYYDLVTHSVWHDLQAMSCIMINKALLEVRRLLQSVANAIRRILPTH